VRVIKGTERVGGNVGTSGRKVGASEIARICVEAGALSHNLRSLHSHTFLAFMLGRHGGTCFGSLDNSLTTNEDAG
jgi:hypothetical protein